MSITTDHGTERGLADFESLTLHKMLPLFVQASVFVEDFDLDNHAGGDGFDGGLAETRLFSHAITVAGMLHIFSNASKDVYKALDSWSMLYDGLKILEPLVTHRDRMDKYVHTCLQGTVHDLKQFRVIAPHLYDKRWGEVHKFCSWLRHRLPVLRVTWDAARYKDSDRSAHV